MFCLPPRKDAEDIVIEAFLAVLSKKARRAGADVLTSGLPSFIDCEHKTFPSK